MNPLLPENNQILAIVPIYTATGEQTKLYTKSEQNFMYDVKSPTLIKHLAARQAVDLYYLKAKAAKLTKTALCQPLVLSPDLLLVPVKFRKPKVIRDSTIGYFNFHEIECSFNLTNTTFIGFKNGLSLPVLWTKQTVDNHLQKAHLTALAQKKFTISIEDIIASILSIPLYRENMYSP